jgi:glycosyltransferase involved in cell wall biosynthesis
VVDGPTRRPHQRLRLLEVGLRSPPEPFVQRKLEGLVARGIEVSVASPLPRDHQRWPLREIPFHRVPLVHERPLLLVPEIAWSCLALLFTRPRRLIASIRATARPAVRDGRSTPRKVLGELRAYLRLARLRADVLHFEWTFSGVRWLPLLELLDCPAVLSCRGSDIYSRSHDPGYQHWLPGLVTAFNRSAAVHCISGAITEEAVLYGLERSKARVIRPAVDTSFFRPPPHQGPDAAGPRLVAIADLRWVKGLEYALLAVRHMLERGLSVHLEVVGGDPHQAVGEPSERQRIMYAADDLGLGERVDFVDRLGREGVRRRLQQAHMLLHASLSEGLPNVALEAMACGLPVVASDAGGTGEAVRHGVEGFVVPAREPAQLAEAAIALWRDPGLRSRMGKAARRRAIRSFPLEREADAYLRLYEEVTAATFRPAPSKRPGPALAERAS